MCGDTLPIKAKKEKDNTARTSRAEIKIQNIIIKEIEVKGDENR